MFLCLIYVSSTARDRVSFFFICEMIRLQSHHDDDLKDRSDVFVFFYFDCMQIFFFFARCYISKFFFLLLCFELRAVVSEFCWREIWKAGEMMKKPRSSQITIKIN